MPFKTSRQSLKSQLQTQSGLKDYTSNHNLKSPDYHHNEINFTDFCDLHLNELTTASGDPLLRCLRDAWPTTTTSRPTVHSVQHLNSYWQKATSCLLSHTIELSLSRLYAELSSCSTFNIPKTYKTVLHYLFPRNKTTGVAKSWIPSFLCTTSVTKISYSTRWSERARDRHDLWCGTKVSVVRCHRRGKNLTTLLARTIRCTILFDRCPHLAVFPSLCQIGYFAKYSVTSKIISNKICDLCDTSSQWLSDDLKKCLSTHYMLLFSREQ